eukprot:6142659-Alexandrium_andersonii.AAC.1
MCSRHNGAIHPRGGEQPVEGLNLLPGGGSGATTGSAARGARTRSATPAGGAGSGSGRGPAPARRPPARKVLGEPPVQLIREDGW